MKLVINSCYGGFGISHEAMLRLGELKGIKLYPAEDSWLTTYWTVPLDQIPEEGTKDYNDFYKDNTFHEGDLARNDPDLVKVVEELGKAASGQYANLVIVDIPADVEWQIEEYDGAEHVSEKHRTWG